MQPLYVALTPRYAIRLQEGKLPNGHEALELALVADDGAGGERPRSLMLIGVHSLPALGEALYEYQRRRAAR